MATKQLKINDTHGGHHGKGTLPKVSDVGARGNGYIEADLAQRVNNAVIKYSGAKNTSDYLATNVNDNLANIVKNMNKYPGDYHLSIHFNAFNGTASGVEVWYWAGDEDSKKKATEMSAELSKLTGLPNRGAKATTSFYVLRNSNGRTLLVEIGFIDNKSDMEKVVPKIDAIGKKIAEVMGHKVVVPTPAPSAPVDTFDITKYHTTKFAMIKLVKDDYAYKEVALKTKSGSIVKKGTVLTVTGIEYSGKYPRFKLKSGLYITTRKDTVEEYKAKTVTAPKPTTPKPVAPKPTPTPVAKTTFKGFTYERAKFTVTTPDGIVTRKGSHGLNATKSGLLKKGDSVIYDGAATKDGYVWIHYIGSGNVDLFVPVRQVGKAAWGTFTAV